MVSATERVRAGMPWRWRYLADQMLAELPAALVYEIGYDQAREIVCHAIVELRQFSGDEWFAHRKVSTEGEAWF